MECGEKVDGNINKFFAEQKRKAMSKETTLIEKLLKGNNMVSQIF